MSNDLNARMMNRQLKVRSKLKPADSEMGNKLRISYYMGSDDSGDDDFYDCLDQF